MEENTGLDPGASEEQIPAFVGRRPLFGSLPFREGWVPMSYG